MPKPARRGRRSNEYPLGTISTYGPDATLATKLVVAVLERPGQRDPAAMRTWTTVATDVRHDPTIAASVVEFLAEYGVKRTVTADRMMGCPHEEGIDYPMGRSCPQCPFWAGIDRFTHEPIPHAAPTVSPSEVLAILAADASEQLEEALTSADAHRDVLVPRLLSALDDGCANPSSESLEVINLFSYALYLLAKWREPRAYPYVVRWLALPEEQPFEIGGDIVTEDGARILAAVCDGDLTPVKQLIVNRDADPFGRSAGLGALALLAAWGEVPREPVVEYFGWLAEEGLEQEPSVVWDSLVIAATDVEASSVYPALRRAYDAGFVNPRFLSLAEFAEIEGRPPGQSLEALREDKPPIDDVLTATSWWSRSEDDYGESDQDADWADVDQLGEPQQPYRAPLTPGRNEPCLCGSGKKFKKCCGR
jgi:hypothetical protein